MQEIKKVIISPPFGFYIRLKNISSVYGTYTLHQRKGLIKQILKTLRWTKKGLVNKIGLRNPGIKRISLAMKEKDILSIASLQEGDFEEILQVLLEFKKVGKLNTNNIEINLSCPNAKVFNIQENILQGYLKNFNIIVKLQPDIDIEKIKSLISLGVKKIHISNTMPTEKGGISGRILKPFNLKTIATLKEIYGNDIFIIAGGGIYSKKDFIDYKAFDVDAFSLSSICFNPFKMLYLIYFINKYYK